MYHNIFWDQYVEYYVEDLKKKNTYILHISSSSVVIIANYHLKGFDTGIWNDSNK